MAKNGNHHSLERKKKEKNKSKATLKSKIKSKLKAKFKKKLKRRLKVRIKTLRKHIKQLRQYTMHESQPDLNESAESKVINKQPCNLLNKYQSSTEEDWDELLFAIDDTTKFSQDDFFGQELSLKIQIDKLFGDEEMHEGVKEKYNPLVNIKNKEEKSLLKCFDETIFSDADTIKSDRNNSLKRILDIDICVSDYLKKTAKEGRYRLKNQTPDDLSRKITGSADEEGSTESSDKASDISLVKDEVNSGNSERRVKKSKLETIRKRELLRFIKKEIPSIKSYFMKEKKCFHFDMPVKLETEDDIKAVRDWLNDPEKIACHSFLPLISNEIVSRQKRKIEEFRFYEKTLQETANPQVQELCRDGIAKFKKNGPVKKRPIRMCSNRDTLVFAHYSRMLGEFYEKYTRDLGFSECVLAYRNTPIAEINGVKCSFRTIPAVYDVVQYVKNHNNKCVALAFDMSSFFDCIDHQNLKKEWKKVLGVDELPADHYNIYKALTRYCYVERSEIEEYVRYMDSAEGRKTDNAEKNATVKAGAGSENINNNQPCTTQERRILRKYFTSIGDFRKFRKWYSQNPKYAAHNSFHKNPGLAYKDAPCGIPQGLSISAILSNIYMIPFDKAVSAYAREKGYLYRRYCDDIMLVGDIAHDDIMKVYEFIAGEIRKRGLKLKLHPFIQDFYNPYSKSQVYDFSSPDIKKLPMQYLGFYFNGSEVRIREGSIAGFYRNMDKAVTASYLRTCRRIKGRIIKERSTGYLFRNKLHKVKIECVKYYDKDGIAFTGDSLPEKYQDQARERMNRRCADKYQSISNDYWFEAMINNLVSRFVLTDIDKITGKVKYRRAFLPNVKRLHRVYSFRSNRNFISYAMNAARIFGGNDKNNTIRRQMRSHSHHLHRKINDAYMKTCYNLKKMVNEIIERNNKK